MMLTQVLGMLLTRIQDIVIGRYISVAAVGTYRIAWRMIDLIAQTTIQPLVGVSFVTLSQLQDDRERFRQAFLRMLGLGALFTFPAIAGFGVLSGEIIPLLFGAKWAASADIAKILTLMAIPFSMNFFIGPALAAIGRSTTIAKGSVVQTAATLALSMLAAPFGLQWVAAAYVFRAYLTMPYHLALFRRDTGIGLVAMMRAIMPPFLASLGMAAALLLVAPYLENILGHGVAYLAVMVPLGCTVFIIGLLLFAADYIRSNLAALLPVWRRLQPKLRRQNVMR
jgi:O-antigen/teichoic acid export membrane protein